MTGSQDRLHALAHGRVLCFADDRRLHTVPCGQVRKAPAVGVLVAVRIEGLHQLVCSDGLLGVDAEHHTHGRSFLLATERRYPKGTVTISGYIYATRAVHAGHTFRHLERKPTIKE